MSCIDSPPLLYYVLEGPVLVVCPQNLINLKIVQWWLKKRVFFQWIFSQISILGFLSLSLLLPGLNND